MPRARTAQATSRQAKRDADRRERMSRVLKLRQEGLSFEAIGKQLGIGTTTAFQDYNAAMSELVPREMVEEMRAFEGTKLDRLEQTAWDWLNRCSMDEIGTASSLIGRITKIMERRSALFGLDRPVPKLLELSYETVATEARREAQMLLDAGVELPESIAGIVKRRALEATATEVMTG